MLVPAAITRALPVPSTVTVIASAVCAVPPDDVIGWMGSSASPSMVRRTTNPSLPWGGKVGSGGFVMPSCTTSVPPLLSAMPATTTLPPGMVAAARMLTLAVLPLTPPMPTSQTQRPPSMRAT